MHRFRLAALVELTALVAATVPAFAQPYDRDDSHRQQEWQHHDEHARYDEHAHYDEYHHHGYYAPPPPPVVYAAPRPGYYAPPPPVVYSPPGVTIGVTIP